MDKIQKLQCVATEKGYGRLSTGTAGVVMLFVFCPMSIVAVACPYWKLSFEVQGNSMTSKASLWDISSSTEIRGKSVDAELKMCGDEMKGFDECGKIDAIRFFVITALLLSLASAVCFLLVFLPFLRVKCTDAMREKLTVVGTSLASVVLLWSFLGACIAGSVNMQQGQSLNSEGYSLNGAGFVFLVLQMFFVISAIAPVVWELRQKSKSASAAENHVGTKQQSQFAPPTAQNAPPKTLMSNGRKADDKDLEKGDAAKNVDAAAVVVGAAEKTSSEC
jgi:hypothetical protein